MTTPNASTIYLADYTPPPYLIDKVDLVFKLAPKATRVSSRIAFRPNPDAKSGDFTLDGAELGLISARIDGQECMVELTSDGLRAKVPDRVFIWECEVEISPATNTSLSGLYMSNGMYCTQCEAEGFRKITYYPDRPDVMAKFDVRVEHDSPVLLSNGNPGAAGAGWATWQDPWPKPSYLFALVAGDLVAHSADFTTMNGRAVTLNIWVRAGDIDKCGYAMDALIRSMKWDEQTYGREYDLDVFNLVAVDDFNAGAMENKGLNIFNSKYVLASPETATDATYALIEGIVAHEYFHNWTGDRITCRDWFQLSLKEGLTVFRDQQFSGDMRNHAVKRIDDVLRLRAAQFREDSGPLAHPVRPESFVEINNFYTATVYEKGAEVIGMLKTLVGDDAYDNALSLYFDRHDGQAATIEDWLKVFEDTTGRDLSQFKRWYSTPGTPKISITDDFNDGTYTLHIKQENPKFTGPESASAQVIPIKVGLLNHNGDEVLPTTVLEMDQREQSFTFSGLASRPIPSILRGFSAPVNVSRETSTQERAFLLAHDTDPFNKWEAGRALGKTVLTSMLTDGADPDATYLDALAKVALDESLDPAFRARVLQLPDQDGMAQSLADNGIVPDPDAIDTATRKLRKALANRLSPNLPGLYDQMAVAGLYSPDGEAAGKRALRGVALTLLTDLDDGKTALAQFDHADNMTEQLGAFANLIPTVHGADAIDRFFAQWRHERLVIDMWFSVQIARARKENALDAARGLTRHADFIWTNPNRFGAVIGAMPQGNPAAFHRPDGQGYNFVADWLIKMDAANQQVAARGVNVFAPWRRYDADRQGLIKDALLRLQATKDLSSNSAEMVARILAG